MAATTAPRSIRLPALAVAGGVAPEFELDRGRHYRVVASRPEARRALINALGDTGLTALVPGDGGLIGNLTVLENILLPGLWQGRESRPVLAAEARAWLARLGAREGLAARLPEELTRFECRLAAYVRGLLANPEVLVFEGLFQGLDRTDSAAAEALAVTYRRHFPFRTAIDVEPDSLGLPGLPIDATLVLQ